MKKSLKLGGFEYDIREIKGLADNGSTEFDTQTILIKENQTEDRKLSAVIHECLEVGNELYDLNLPHTTIQTLEAFLFQVYKDNFER